MGWKSLELSPYGWGFLLFPLVLFYESKGIDYV